MNLIKNYNSLIFSHTGIKIILALLLSLSNISTAELPGQSHLSKHMTQSDYKKIIVAIDPGHPSETSSGCAHHGTTELQICWEVALKLEELIAKESILSSIKTKQEVNTKVTNRERAEIANKAGAAILVRLHCDSGNGSGYTVYYPDKPGTAQGVTGPNEDVISQSRLAAECMQLGLAKILGSHLKLNPIRTDSITYVGLKQGALTGSIFSRVPAVVVEMVYLSNASDAVFIKDAKGQDLVARGILAGIEEFISKK